MNARSKKSGSAPTPEPSVTFNYIKGTQFRVVHVDGAIGGITPSGKIHMSIYSERPAIPQQTIHALSPEGRLGAEMKEKRISKPGIVREIDADIIMDASTASEIAEWIAERLKEFEEFEERKHSRKK